MPTYEYRCHKCGHRFSRFQRISEPPVKKCPNCQSSKGVERLISGGAGLIFKGSGFYITDYARQSDRTKGKKPLSDQTGEKSVKKDD